MSEPETLTSDPSKSGETLPTPAEFSTSTTTMTLADAISFNIWPPTNRTRDAVLRRLVETLTTDSVLCKRYGTVPAGEAEETARGIEQDAFAAAQAEHEARCGAGSGSRSGSSSVEEGIEILQVYSREVSRRMLEFCKSRAEKVTAAAAAAAAAAPASAPAEVGTE